MYRNYLKIALRSMKKHKGYSLTNIAGLAVGMTCCVLIMLWVHAELSFDQFNENGQNIYRIYHHLTLGGADRRTPSAGAPWGPALVEQVPEVLNAARIRPGNRSSVTFEDKQFFEEDFFYADNSLLDLFTFPISIGDKKTVLSTANSVVLTEETAHKYFGDQNPVGLVLRFDDQFDYTVTGVMADMPDNSHLQFDFLISFETLYAQDSRPHEHWGAMGNPTYLLLADGADPRQVEAQAAGIIDENLGETLKQVGATLTLLLQPLAEIHLYSDFGSDTAQTGAITYVYLFSAIAVFILLIACINFVNLSTARSAGRAREIGMRKAFGAARSRLVGQFLGESLLYSFLAVVLTIAVVPIALPLFNSLAQRNLVFDMTQPIWMIPALVGLAILVGLVAGSYPALFLSSFRPVKVLKGTLTAGASNSKFRRILVVSQFTISVILIIGTITIFGQVEYMKNRALGFNKEHVVIFPNPSDTEQVSMESLRAEFAKVPGVVAIAASQGTPGNGYSMTNFHPEGYAEDEQELMANINVDHNFLSTLGMELAAGRDFSADLTTDSGSSCLINEAAVRRFGWENPIGKTIQQRVHNDSGIAFVDRTVVGVVKDFHFESLRAEIVPLYIGNLQDGLETFSARIAGGDISEIVGRLEDKFKELAPSRAFDYFFLDESFDLQYQMEEQLGKIALTFCLLAVFIGCLGLLGLSSYTAEQRTKEIGIRKVLGASVAGIIRLLSQEFLVLVVLANVVGAPVAYYVMDGWLAEFAYRISVDWRIFAASGLTALLIALLAVSLQAIRAARSNPVKAIKYE
ncbi:MAG: ABC transporter permease [candidate division Zixibacteria bacterium]|nr:ABC transporter permease [candidate division Zixibacteria bacterium]MDH3937061.1 ABC transporter permease [candidate division Zixibacteria bacterium]MDH4032536.1 ABC transporter permease [candidate division Zixibacteria bacterium]